MCKKIIKLLTNNLGLKIASILVAIIVWLVVVNMDNPDKTVSFTIPVEVVGDDTLTELGKVYEVVNGSDVATIYVTGKRMFLDTMSASDFHATADLANIDFQSAGDIKMIPITVTASRHEKDLNIERRTVNMQITIEDLSTERLPVSGNPQGTPGEGYAIGEVSVTPTMIEVSGPLSLVSRVKRVAANINVEGATGNVNDYVVPVLYDENDQVLESPRLKLNQDRVKVEAEMLGTKEVDIRCLTTGEPLDGFVFTGLDARPQTIWIKGAPSVLNNISEIVIPGEAINLTGSVSDVENSIDITPYVEALDAMLLNPDENKIAVIAFIERLEVKDIEIPVSNIELLNENADYRTTFGTGSITVQVRGRKELLESYEGIGITASVDLTGVEPGDHILQVQLRVPMPYQAVGITTVQVHVAEKGEDPEEDPEGGGSDNPDNDHAGDGGEDDESVSTGGSVSNGGGTGGSTGGSSGGNTGSTGGSTGGSGSGNSGGTGSSSGNTGGTGSSSGNTGGTGSSSGNTGSTGGSSSGNTGGTGGSGSGNSGGTGGSTGGNSGGSGR